MIVLEIRTKMIKTIICYLL